MTEDTPTPEVVGEPDVPTALPEDLTPVGELLGMLAYGELLAFDRLAADARLAPDLRRRAALAETAAAEIAVHRRLVERLSGFGIDPERAMAPFVAPLRAYHERTQPRDWPEALAKAYVGDAIAEDFVREVASRLPDRDRRQLRPMTRERRYRAFFADELRREVNAGGPLVHRLSLWARRISGEALAQAYQVTAARPRLTALITGDADDPRQVHALLKRLAYAHTDRMSAVGLRT